MVCIVTGVSLQEEARHRRHERPRKDKGADEGEHHRLSQWPKQITGHAAELKHRREHDVEHEQRHEGRNDDLLCAVQNRRLDRFALLEVEKDVLERDCAFVDEHADRQRQPAQRHDVDGLAEHCDGRHREQDRQRDGDDDDQRGTPAAEEQQNHQAHQSGGQDGLAQHAKDRRFDEYRLITDRAHVQARRQALADPR